MTGFAKFKFRSAKRISDISWCTVPPQYVVECFMGSSLFHKALKEAFEAFCNKQVAGCTIAEIMANFCNNLLKRVSLDRLLLFPVCLRTSSMFARLNKSRS